MSRTPDRMECRDIYNVATQGNISGLMQKITSGLSPDCQNIYTNSESPLYGATKYEKLDSVTTLLTNGANVNYRSGNGETALTIAAQMGNMSIFNYLMTYNPDTNIGNNAGLVPLMTASLGNNVEMVTSLLSHGADSNKQMVSGQTSLHMAASGRANDVITVLLANNPSLAMVLDGWGKSALESQIINGYSYSAQVWLNKKFLEHPEDPRIADGKAHMDKTLSTMKLLLENGAPCSAACQARLFENPDLKAAADLYGATHDHSDNLSL